MRAFSKWAAFGSLAGMVLLTACASSSEGAAANVAQAGMNEDPPEVAHMAFIRDALAKVSLRADQKTIARQNFIGRTHQPRIGFECLRQVTERLTLARTGYDYEVIVRRDELSQALEARITRRNQLIQMLVAEKNRRAMLVVQRTGSIAMAKSIDVHIHWLEKKIAERLQKWRALTDQARKTGTPK